MTTTIEKSRETRTLEANIKAHNTANRYALEFQPALRAIFEPLVGTKVIKKDKSLIAGITLPDFPEPRNGDIHIFKYSSDYSLVWIFKACVNIEGECSCVYAEAAVYVADLNGQHIERMCAPFEGRTDYTLEEVLAKRAAYEEARKAVDEARSVLHPFI